MDFFPRSKTPNQGSSRCTHHEPCPSCRERGQDRSGNNLGVFDDGHKWCFSCGYRVAAASQSVASLSKQLLTPTIQPKGILTLPSDYTPCLPPQALAWLDKYGITHKEILTHKLGWSQQYERLICPVYSVSGQLLFFQGRSFTSDRKAINFGSPEDTFVILGGGHPDLDVVLVEDLASGIKVSRHACAMVLWGSHISNERLVKLSKIADKLIIWLDRDKARYSIARRIKASIIFEEVKSIITSLDPKDYSNFEICNFLGKDIK